MPSEDPFSWVMRVVLAVSGTRGDVQPMIALALALQNAEHLVTLVGPPNFAEEAAHFGVAYRPCGRDFERFLNEHRGEVGGNPFKMVRVLRGTIADDIREQFDTLTYVARGADLLLASGMMFAGSSVAD